MIVKVVDHVSFEMDVTSAQAIAYVRKLVPGWEESPGRLFCYFVERVDEDARSIDVPLHDGFSDFARRMGELCEQLVEYGFAKQPSDVLRAMAQEPR